MARTNYVDLPVGQEELYFSGLQSGDRFSFPRIVRKNAFFSRKKIANLKAKSYLPVISDLWANFTDEQKTAWHDVDPHPKNMAGEHLSPISQSELNSDIREQLPLAFIIKIW